MGTLLALVGFWLALNAQLGRSQETCWTGQAGTVANTCFFGISCAPASIIASDVVLPPTSQYPNNCPTSVYTCSTTTSSDPLIFGLLLLVVTCTSALAAPTTTQVVSTTLATAPTLIIPTSTPAALPTSTVVVPTAPTLSTAFPTISSASSVTSSLSSPSSSTLSSTTSRTSSAVTSSQTTLSSSVLNLPSTTVSTYSALPILYRRISISEPLCRTRVHIATRSQVHNSYLGSLRWMCQRQTRLLPLAGCNESLDNNCNDLSYSTFYQNCFPQQTDYVLFWQLIWINFCYFFKCTTFTWDFASTISIEYIYFSICIDSRNIPSGSRSSSSYIVNLSPRLP